MKLHLDSTAGRNRISGYGDGYVTVNEERLHSSAIVMPRELVRDWPPEAFEQLEAAHLRSLAGRGLEIVLLGTGSSQQFPAPSVVAPLIDGRIGLEVMDTAAACRTFNILVAEERAVAAALLLIGGAGDRR